MATGISGCSARGDCTGRRDLPDDVVAIDPEAEWLAFSPPRAGAIYRPAQPPHILDLTIVHYDYKPKRARNAKPAQEFPNGRIVSAKPPRKRHYGEIVQGVPDDGQRTELARQFFERTLKDTPPR
jgi:hypothetical protein